MPLLLWFTRLEAHSARWLVAERLSTAILSVDRRSFPIRSPQGRSAIGHRINMERLAPAFRAPASSPSFASISLGRTSPAKGYETIARGAELAGVEFEVDGHSRTAEERAERDRLAALGVRDARNPPFRIPRFVRFLAD